MDKKIKGLTDNEVLLSREKHGNNSLKKEKTKSFFRRFIENLSDPIIRVLLIALGIQLIVTMGNCDFLEIGGIVVAILISTTVSTISEYTSEKSFERLRESEAKEKTSVLRNGRIETIAPDEIVVGDLIYLNPGEKIFADGEMVEGELFVDQSALNGESAEVKKKSGKCDKWDLSSQNKVYRGSAITSGNGIMRVEKVGANTFYGMVATDVQAQTRESPLKHRLSMLASQISRIGYVMAIIVAIAYLFNALIIDNGFDKEAILSSLQNIGYLLSTLTHAFTLMITVVVVSAPEGLPMMITVVLSANMKRLIKNKVLVKRLVGIETAGSMNILFTDKTGTITEGRPKCEKIIGDFGEASNVKGLKKHGAIYENLCISAIYNTDVRIDNGNITGGNSTDRAIFEWFKDEEKINASIVDKTPFTSDRKYSSVKLKNGKTIIKGAAEIIISLCSSVLKSDGTVAEIDVQRYLSEYQKASMRGGRVIAVAMLEEGKMQGMALIALIVMKDKIRTTAKEAIRSLTDAGIQIVMLTGDSKETATAIARESGIISANGEDFVMSAEELSKMSDDDLKSALPRLRVLSRAMPRDKTRLVRIAQEIDMVVGMTGDGINDAPSLKLADVGFAMGSGTDIAKSSADIVILDDSIDAISKTVLFGRTIFKSIRKFITFQLIMNLAACGVSIIGQFIGVETPITIIQMLWINIIMDTLGGLAFAGEPPSARYMKEKPKPRSEQILSSNMIHQIGYTGAYTLALSIFFLSAPIVRKYYDFDSSPDAFYTAFYALFILAGIANCFTSRSERLWILSDISKNIAFILIMVGICAIQFVMIYFGGEVFRCIPLNIGEMMLSLTLAFTVIPFDFIRRIIKKLS